jgi:large subunit ribosomal protein L1
MDKKQVLESLKQLRTNSPKRNFKQRIDLILTLRALDMKKTDNQINSYVTLHHLPGKKAKVCAMIGPELLSQAKEVCDEAISSDNFKKYDKKATKKLAEAYDYFIAQATVMPQVAQIFGRVFGPKGKMPNPKAGCVVPPNANLKPLYDRLQKTIKIKTGNQSLVQCGVGSEDMKDEEIADNVLFVMDSVAHLLPHGNHNIKKSLLKFTMGHPIKIGAKPEVKSDAKKEAKVKKSEEVTEKVKEKAKKSEKETSEKVPEEKKSKVKKE